MKIINLNREFGYDTAVIEDGSEIVLTGWNGESWNEGRPVYRFEIDGIDLSTLEENSPEWDRAVEIVEVV